MRVFKFILILLFLLVGGFFAYWFLVYPRVWYSETKHESVGILKAANSLRELTNAVGYIGIYIPLTNNEWIAIRYRDTHGGGVLSCAIARDSGGDWFESDRHFCGFFQSWPNTKPRIEDEVEFKKNYPQTLTNPVYGLDSNGDFPSYRQMVAIESATNLDAARIALQKIGFKFLKQ